MYFGIVVNVNVVVNVVGSNPPLITCISRSFHSGNHAGEGMGSSRRGQGSTSDLCFSKLGNLNFDLN